MSWSLSPPPLTRDRRVLAAGLAVVTAPILSYAVYSYRRWLALGPGGVPYNALGWLVNVLARPLARFDVRAVAPYTMEDQRPLYGDLGHVSFFVGGGGDGDGDGGDGPRPLLLPQRRSGPRPDVPSFVVPQRQTTEQATTAMLARQEAFLAALAAANASLLRARPSKLEGPAHDALWLLASESNDDDNNNKKTNDNHNLPPVLRRTRGEFLHPHGEGSSHAILSLTDAARLVELGWAERHPLTGSPNRRIGLPWSYVLIYAPRNDDEFAVWKSIVMAAARFVAAASERVVEVKTP